MYRITQILIYFIVSGTIAVSQAKLDDFGRVVVNSYMPENTNIPAEAARSLKTKMDQITTSTGMGGSDANPRFIITASINIGTKDLIPGPPQMIAQNMDVTFFIGDAIKNIKFASTTLSVKGVGTNENKAFIEAFKMINTRNKDLAAFLEEGKRKIVQYYATECDFLIGEAFTLVKQEKYDEAIYQLTLVPEVCEECYFKTLDTMNYIYQRKIDADCRVKFTEAKGVWASGQNPANAESVAEILAEVNPFASCQNDVQNFIKAIDAKLRADERARWAFKLKQYNDKIAAEKEKRRIAEEKSIRDDTFRENQATRDATYKENQSQRDAVFRENQAQRDAVYREKQSQRDAKLQEKQSSRNYELDKLRVKAYRDVGVAYANNQPKKITYNNIFW